MVYVLNNDGSPLMPCTEAKARHLVEGGKAKVVRRTPFIIRLTFLVEGEVNTEAVTLGVDAGSSLIGVSVTTEGRVLLEAEVEVRNDVPQNMEEKRSKRRARRNRKTRYREVRLDNRKRPKGWHTWQEELGLLRHLSPGRNKGSCRNTLQALDARRACEYESYLQGGYGGSSIRTSLMVSLP